MRTGKDQLVQEQQQFFYKISRNKPSWNSPVISPANSALITKPKNTRHPSTNKRPPAPTVDTNHRSPLSKLIVNKIARSGSSSLGLRQSIVLLDKSSAGKLPGLIMNEIQSSTHIASSVKTFEVSVQNASPTLSNLLRKNSSVVEEKARITLQPIRQGSGTQLVRSRSPNESQDNVKYLANKRKMSKNNLDASDSNSRVVEAQQNNSGTAAAAVVPANKGTTAKMKIVIQPRETKISKILREIKWNIDSEGGSGNESQEKEVLKTAGGNLKNSFTIRSKSSVLKSAKISGPNKVEIVENKHTNPKGNGIPKKFISYRNVLDSQTVTFMKARAPLMQEPKDSIDLSTEITTAEVIPPFFRNMKANLSARNREVRQKFAKTINYIIRKLGLLNLTLEEIVTKKPFPSAPYEREGSRPLLDAAKIGDVSEVETLIILNPYLVYEYDLLKQTALHWAARRGYTKMMRILLEKGADPDARDVSGRTPLFLAARGSLLNSVKLLLYYGANPMIKSGAGRLAIDYATELHIKSLLTRGYKLHAFLGTYSGKRFKQTWVLMDKHEFEVRDDELE